MTHESEVKSLEEDIRDRIGMVREFLKKSQEEFGIILGVTKSTISLLETKKRDPSERLLRDICREFGVNDTWLRTGEGGEENMFIKPSPTNLAYNHFGYLMGNASPQKKAVLSALIEMVYQYPDDKWDYVFNQFENCLEEAKKAKNKSEES